MRRTPFWRRLVEPTAGLPAEQVPLDSKHYGNWKDCFVGYGHLNAVGAVAYSEQMGAGFSANYRPALTLRPNGCGKGSPMPRESPKQRKG